MGAEYDRFRLITVESQAVVTEPRMESRQTIFKVSDIGRKSIGSRGKVELGIVSILLERYIELSGDLTDGRGVERKEERTENRSLGHTSVAASYCRRSLASSDCLRSIREVRSDKGKNIAGQAKASVESGK